VVGYLDSLHCRRLLRSRTRLRSSSARALPLSSCGCLPGPSDRWTRDFSARLILPSATRLHPSDLRYNVPNRTSSPLPMHAAIRLPVKSLADYLEMHVSQGPRDRFLFLYQDLSLKGTCYPSYSIDSENLLTTAIMHFPILLLAIASLCSVAAASPLQGRQEAPGNSSTADLIAQCAPYPFLIHQFTTFSGSDTAPPQISFFFTNENGVDVNGGVGGDPVFCSVTLPKYSDIMSNYAVWSCQVRYSSVGASSP
jgi:hypothetical protein